MKNTTPTETQEQRALVKWLRAAHPKLKFYSTPNEAKRSYRLANLMRLMGMSSGVPDICIPALFLYIEMKRKKGSKTSPDQQEWIDYLNSCGYEAVICYGADEAIDVVKKRMWALARCF